MSCNGCGSGSGTPKGCGNNGHCSSGGCSKLEVYDWLSDISLDAYSRNNIYEISFKNGSHKGFFKHEKRFDVFVGDHVVVESAVGYDIGQVTLSGELVRLQMKKKRVNEKTYEFKPILRIARDHEMQLLKQVREKEKETMLKARILARKLGLNMKLGDVEYQADGRKAIFYYFADGRVDFRELIKVLATEFRIKIEMRQIGARQEAGIVGGIGSCGRELCCSTWLTSFKSVNTSAARYQNLSINQTKLSGQCGRLKCCLNYELDTYLDAIKALPEHAEKIFTEVGEAHLVKTDVLKGLMFYQYSRDGKFFPIPLDNVHAILELNRNGKRPADLNELVVEEKEKEEKIEFADVVGHISLSSLDKNDRKRRFKDKQKKQQQGQSGTPSEGAPKGQGQQPGQGNRPPKGQGQPRPPRPAGQPEKGPRPPGEGNRQQGQGNRNRPGNRQNRNRPQNPNNPNNPNNPSPPKPPEQ